MEWDSLLDEPAGESMPQGVEDHTLAWISYPVVEAQLRYALHKDARDLRSLFPVCCGEEQTMVILNSVTLLQHRLDWSIYERKAVLAVFGIANQDLAIVEVDVSLG